MKVRTGNSACLDLRLADSRIAVGDSVDVISTLYYAAKHSPLECLSTVYEPEPPVVRQEPEKPVVKEEPKQPVQPEPEKVKEVVAEPEHKKTVSGGVIPGTPKSQGGNFFRTIGEKIRGMLSEEDDYDEVLRDDMD